MPKLEPVGRDNTPDPEQYEPITLPIIGHSTTDHTEIQESFLFQARLSAGFAFAFERRIRQADKLTYEMVLDYLAATALPGEFDRFMAFIARPGVEVHAQTIVDAQQALAGEYVRDRPTPARSSSGRSSTRRTSGAGSGGKGSTSTRSRSSRR